MEGFRWWGTHLQSPQEKHQQQAQRSKCSVRVSNGTAAGSARIVSLLLVATGMGWLWNQGPDFGTGSVACQGIEGQGTELLSDGSEKPSLLLEERTVLARVVELSPKSINLNPFLL